MWPFGRRGKRGSPAKPSDLGPLGEKAAARFMRARGMKILGRNYSCPVGEVDIIALDRRAKAIVFAEVKTRSDAGKASPLSAINTEKQNRVRRIAGHYLSSRDIGVLSVRFDAVSVIIRPGHKPEIDYIPDAF